MVDWVRVAAPVRVLDAGGWSDTWFARWGKVCHLAVGPGVEVLARAAPLRPGQTATVQLHVSQPAGHYCFSIDALPGHHPLLEAAIRRWSPPGYQLDITLSSPVPPGSGLGTSASVVVALIAALRALGGYEDDRRLLVSSAHEVETIDLGLQSGIQDQAAAAFGGANMVDISPYPHCRVQQLEMPPATWEALGRRVVTAYLRSRHESSAIHEMVIKGLADDSAHAEALMAPLRTAAVDAAGALVAGDIDGYGDAMIAGTRGQVALHPALVGPAAQDVIDLGRRHGAVGWKVNGAGGNGGTVSLIGPDDPGAMLGALQRFGAVAVLDLRPAAEGVHVVDQG